MSFLYPGYRS